MIENQDLQPDERKLITLLRSCRRYANIKIEKRPTKSYPNGELSRVTVEDSFMLDEISLPVLVEIKSKM